MIVKREFTERGDRLFCGVSGVSRLSGVAGLSRGQLSLEFLLLFTGFLGFVFLLLSSASAASEKAFVKADFLKAKVASEAKCVQLDFLSSDGRNSVFESGFFWEGNFSSDGTRIFFVSKTGKLLANATCVSKVGVGKSGGLEVERNPSQVA